MKLQTDAELVNAVSDGQKRCNWRQAFLPQLKILFNLDPEPKWTLGLNVDCNLLINSTENFDKWVLGAMAELSDDGKAPENITYESVLQSAKQIRQSLNH